jgi:hypothetical protein
LGALSGQTLASLFKHQCTSTLKHSIEAIISGSVNKLFGVFIQREYTSAARVIAAGLVSSCSLLIRMTAGELLREVCIRSGHEMHIEPEQISCKEAFNTIRLLGVSSFISCGSLCALRFIEPWDDASLALAMDCVSATLMNSYQHLSQDQAHISDSSGDDDTEQQFVGKVHVFEVRKRFRIIFEGMLLLCECLKRCSADSVEISPEWLKNNYCEIMGLCCCVDHVGATETAASVLFQIFEIRIVHLRATARMLLLRTLSNAVAALSIDDVDLVQHLDSVENCIAIPERCIENYGWRRSSHVCLPVVSSLKALVSSHHLHLRNGTDLFDAFVDAVIARAKLDPASSSGIDCLNLLYHITNEHIMISRLQSRRSEIFSVCFAAFGASSFNSQSAACLVTSNLVTKVYGVLFARKREYEIRVRSLMHCDWVVFTSLSADSAPGALISLFAVFSMIRASDDDLLTLEPVERSRNLVLACCRSPIAKLRFSASRALPRLVAPSATTALIQDISIAIEDAKIKRLWNHMHGLTLAAAALQASLRAE